MSRRRPTDVALLVASLLVGLGIAEAVLRLGPFDALFRPAPLAPNLDVPFATEEFRTTVRTNHAGLREDREIAARSEGRYRIAAIGDSVTFGWGVEREEAFPAVLETRLRETRGADLEVINFGAPGQTPVDYLRTFLQRARPLGPDLVLVAFLPANDCPLGVRWGGGADAEARRHSAQQVRAGDPPRSYLVHLLAARGVEPVRQWLASRGSAASGPAAVRDPLGKGGNPLETAAIEAKVARNAAWQARYEALKEAGWVARGQRWDVTPWLVVGAIVEPGGQRHALFLDPETRERMEKQWRRCENVLEATAEAVAAAGAQFVLLVLPAAAQVSAASIEARRALGIEMPDDALHDRTLNDKLAEFCRRRDLHCIDTLDEARRAARAGAELFFPLDGHPTAQGHALIAEEVARELAPRVAR